jgi:hypothetical protein
MSSARRDFFKKVAGTAATLAGVEALRGATGTTPSAHAAGAGDQRELAAGHFALELEGAMAGFLKSVEGGDATADVVTVVGGESCLPRKNLANVRYEDIALACGTGMSAAFYGWLQGAFTCEASRKSGAILAADFNFKERARRGFTNALISEIGFPALDAAGKDAAYMTVTLSPESTQRQKGSGNPIPPCTAKGQKKWLTSNFRLTIDGLDCTKVNKVDGLTIKQQAVGREPTSIEFPNLAFTLPESAAQPFYEWHEDFVINGNNGSESERNGMLEYLTPNLSEALFTIDFRHLGIFKLAPEKAEANSDQILRVRAEMYCEQMTFKFGKSAAGC